MSSKKAKRKSNQPLNANAHVNSVSSEASVHPKADVKTTKEQDKYQNLMSKNFERFFTKSFLLNQGSIIFKSLIRSSAYYLLTLAAQLFVFGGGLGLVWVLSHLEPKGDLARYLLPLTILAMPVAVISQNESWLDRLLNSVFVLSFLGFFAWSCAWYFQYPDWGYEAKWIAIEALGLGFLLYFSLKKSLHNIRGPQKALIRSFWLLGIFVSLSSLSFLGYYIATQSAPEPSTSNLLSGGAFVLFLSIMVVRVYWLDGFRMRRANRAEYNHPLDHIILFEWIVPKSFNFTLMLGMLLVAQSMLFSTVYRAYQHQDKQRFVKQTQSLNLSNINYTSPDSLQNESYYSSIESTLNPQIVTHDYSGHNELYSQLTSRFDHVETDMLSPEILRPTISLSAWMFFSFKPYVFPKDKQGREVDAPIWFKYLGRILIGLIIAILLTKQLNIWKQIMASYWRLLGAARTEKHRGSSDTLTRQQEEMLDQITGIFNHYSLPWRWLLLYSVSAPTLSLKWRVILDPASAYYLGLERLHDWVIQRWHAAIAISALVIAVTTLPFCYLNPGYLPHFWNSFIPTMSAAIFIAILRLGLSLRPPNSYQWWIWWLLIFHTIISILNFFLSINIGTDKSFWTQALWYTDSVTIFAYPAIYLMGTDRYTNLIRPDRRVSVADDDCDVVVRRRLLIAFADTEHRQWLINQLTQRLHPVRSNALHLRLITPSLALEGLERLRGLMVTLREFLTPIFGDYKRALRSWTAVVFIAWLGTLTFHLFINHKMLPIHVLSAYLFDLAIIIMPALFLWLIASLQEHQTKSLSSSKVWFILHFFFLIVLSSLAFKLWFEPSTHFESIFKFPDTPRSYRSWLVWVSPPVLAFWQLFTTRLKRRSVEQSNLLFQEDPSSFDTNEELVLERFSLLRKIEFFLQNLEEQLVSSVYQKTTRNRLFEFRYQPTMVLNFAKIIEHSFERLRNGEWFHEETHALSRVKSELLSKTHPQADHKLEVVQELSETLEAAFDTLGSLLHDLTLTTHLLTQDSHSNEENIDLPPNPEIIVILEALSQIAKYPLPKRVESETSELLSTQLGALDRLYECQQEITALVSFLTVQAYHEEASKKHLTKLISDEERANLLKLWCLLEAQLEQSLTSISDFTLSKDSNQLSPALEFIYQQLSDEGLAETQYYDQVWLDILLATLHHPYGSNLINRLSAKLKKTSIFHSSLQTLLALNSLPTPVALLLKNLEDIKWRYQRAEEVWRLHHQKRLDNEITTGEVQKLTSKSLEIFESNKYSSKILRNIQYPRQLELIEREMKAQQHLDQLNHDRYEALSALYFGTFAYLICLLKDVSLGPLLQPLSWDSAVALGDSLSTLNALDHEEYDDCSAELLSLIKYLFNTTDAEKIEQNCRDRRAWLEINDLIDQLCSRLRKTIESNRAFPAYVWGGKQKIDYEAKSKNFLIMKGIYPRFNEINFHKSQMYQEEAHSFDLIINYKEKLSSDKQTVSTQLFNLGRGLRLADSKRASQINYYSALWLLNLLHSLVNSDDLLRSPKDLPKKIEQLNTLLTRIGRILKPFAGEEQIIIERLFDKTFRRLFALKTMGIEGHDILGGKGTVDFESSFKKAEDYINGLEAKRERELDALSWLNLTPDLDFSFLLNIEYLSEGELRTYLSLQGAPQVVFKGH